MTPIQINKIIKYLKRFILMMFLIPLSLLWGEVFTRVLLPQNVDSKMNIFTSDSVIGFKYKPNSSAYEKGREYNALYQINSLGLRDREYVAKKQGVFRILLLGDSFSVSHGLPIEDSLSRQLEFALQTLVENDRIPVKIEVINTAVGGYSPYNYWKAYLKWKPVFQPDLVVLGLSPDDYDSTNEDLIYIFEDGIRVASFKEGHTLQTRKRGIIRQWQKWLSWNSEFYILLRNFFYYNDLIGRISVWFEDKKEARNNQLQQYLVPQPAEIVKHWMRSFAYVDKLYKSTVSDNVSLVIIPIPLKEEIDSKVLQRTLLASNLTQGEININQPLYQIEAFCKDRAIPFLEPRLALRKRQQEAPCYFMYDGHWIGEGIRIASSSMARQWRNMKIPPWNNFNDGANHINEENVNDNHQQR